MHAFTPPAPPGFTPTERPAGIHFSTFVAAFMAVPEYCMETAPPLFTTTTQVLRLALETVDKAVRGYLQFYTMELVLYTQNVRDLLVAVMLGLEEAMHKLAEAAAGLWRLYPHVPTSPGGGVDLPTP